MPETRTTIPTLTFSDPDQFCDELRERGPNVGKDDVVHVSYAKHPCLDGPEHHLSVVASYLRNLSYADETPVVVVVKLQSYQGRVPHDEVFDSTTEVGIRLKAAAVRHKLETAARTYGFTVGAGVWQVPS